VSLGGEIDKKDEELGRRTPLKGKRSTVRSHVSTSGIVLGRQSDEH
jgi:hypothetical protein